jgi:hypothetical protein
MNRKNFPALPALPVEYQTVDSLSGQDLKGVTHQRGGGGVPLITLRELSPSPHLEVRGHKAIADEVGASTGT